MKNEFIGAKAFLMIPAQVTNDKEAMKGHTRAILLLGHILAMLNVTGEFYMSNSTIAKRMFVKPRTVINDINYLKSKGWIETAEVKDKNTNATKGRMIYPGKALNEACSMTWGEYKNTTPVNGDTPTPCTVMASGGEQSCTGGVHDDTPKYNRINRTTNRTEDINRSTSVDRQTKSTSKPKKSDSHLADYKTIISYLNQKTGKHYKPSSKTSQKLIHARITEGFTVADFKKVIDNKSYSWQHTDYWKYMRPETLFGTKFESYLNENSSKNFKKDPFGGLGGEAVLDVNDDDLPF